MGILIIALLVLALDQASKYWIMSYHVVGQLGYTGAWNDLDALRSFLSQADVAADNAIPKDGSFLVLSFTPNDAALWGIGNGKAWAVRLLLALTALFLFVLLFFTIRTRKKLPSLSKVILGLLIGGSVGNLYDRIAYGFVRDMIYAKFINFPIFNIADAAICIAIALLVFEAFFRKFGVFEAFEDDYRHLFRLPTREEAERLHKERKKNKLSHFEEVIPEEEDETAEPEESTPNDETEEPNADGDAAADRGTTGDEN